MIKTGLLDLLVKQKRKVCELVGCKTAARTDSSVKWKMIYMHARLTRRKESSALVIQAELRFKSEFY